VAVLLSALLITSLTSDVLEEGQLAGKDMLSEVASLHGTFSFHSFF
jgi:hypothetical protein